ncbi:hypothetical protein Syun_023162 [Stephania yunnanensis]|uniref:Uncharacterized protein n=1 Tax=Stephania yunnanensis TaxID=152371 RepID=A0AAP0F8F7_9MAGN
MEGQKENVVTDYILKDSVDLDPGIDYGVVERVVRFVEPKGKTLEHGKSPLIFSRASLNLQAGLYAIAFPLSCNHVNEDGIE